MAILQSGDRLLDMGAGIGLTALLAAGKIGAENVIATEANPNLIKVMKKNFSMNSKEVEIEHAILAASNGCVDSVDFYLREDFWSSSSLPNGDDRISVKVPVRPISALLDKTEISIINEFFSARHILRETHECYIGVEAINDMIASLICKGFYLYASKSTPKISLFFKLN